MMLNVALAGFGKAGEFFHAPVIGAVQGLKLVKALERSRQRSRELYPDVVVVNNYEAILEDPNIDIVVIVTPNETHYDMAYKALNAGKHVVVDKPFTIYPEQADELISLAKNKGLILTVYHNRRLDGTIQAVKKVLESGMIGQLVRLEIKFDRYRPEVDPASWREKGLYGSGLLYDIGSHLLDHAIYLFGDPLRVEGVIEYQRKNSVADDFFDITCFYEHHEVKLTAGMLVKEKTDHITLIGKEGKFIIRDLDPQESLLKSGLRPGTMEWYMSSGNINAELLNAAGQFSLGFPSGAYDRFYKNLRDAIVHGSDLLVKPEEARAVVGYLQQIKGQYV